MQIFVKGKSGQVYSFDVEPNDSFETIEKKINEKEPPGPNETYSLISNGKHLEKNKTLQDYNVQEGQTLLIVVHHRGGN